ncbi:MAG: GreA/GreB family elongation factor [Victivallaceae bacterium]|nr:GreA/GreB family elongation factor [Victivallaceae bacterium]
MSKKIISKSDYEKIDQVLQNMLYSNSSNIMLEEFSNILDEAKKIHDEKPLEDIVTLNSHVELIDVNNNKVMLKKIVLPPANFDLQELSVLSPVGMSVIGAKTGDVIDCKVPSGIRRIKVQNILNAVNYAGFV